MKMHNLSCRHVFNIVFVFYIFEIVTACAPNCMLSSPLVSAWSSVSQFAVLSDVNSTTLVCKPGVTCINNTTQWYVHVQLYGYGNPNTECYSTLNHASPPWFCSSYSCPPSPLFGLCIGLNLVDVGPSDQSWTSRMNVVRFDNDARLSTVIFYEAQSLSTLQLQPAFSPDVYVYTVTGIPYADTSIGFGYSMASGANSPSASILYTANVSSSSSLTADTPAGSLLFVSGLDFSLNVLTIYGVAQDATVNVSYTFTLLRLNGEARLSEFKFTAPSALATMMSDDGGFAADTTTYDLTRVGLDAFLDAETMTPAVNVTFSFTMQDVLSSAPTTYIVVTFGNVYLTVNNYTGADITMTAAALTRGTTNTMDVTGYAQDATITQSYSFIVYINSITSTLSALAIIGPNRAISPIFSSSVLSYSCSSPGQLGFGFSLSLSVGAVVKGVNSAARVDVSLAGATIFTMQGSSGAVQSGYTLHAGVNTLNVTVYAEDSAYSTSYVVIITVPFSSSQLPFSSSAPRYSSSLKPFSSSRMPFSSSQMPSSSRIPFSSSFHPSSSLTPSSSVTTFSSSLIPQSSSVPIVSSSSPPSSAYACLASFTVPSVYDLAPASSSSSAPSSSLSCNSLCASTAGCVGFVYSSSGGDCTLKSSMQFVRETGQSNVWACTSGVQILAPSGLLVSGGFIARGE